MQRRIAGEVAGKAKDKPGGKAGHAPPGQAMHEQSREAAGQDDVNQSFHLQPVESADGCRTEPCEEQENVADRIKQCRFSVGQEGMTGVYMGIPDRQLPSQQRFLLKEAVGQVMARKVAIGKCRQSEQVRREEQRGQCAECPNCREIRMTLRSFHLRRLEVFVRLGLYSA